MKTGEAMYTTRKRVPCVSLVMPFRPTMRSKGQLTNELQKATRRIKDLLDQKYDAGECEIVMEKLTAIVSDLNFNTHKKSIAIFVSGQFEKVYYLNLPLTERICVDDSFAIRDLVGSKKESHNYLLALLSNTSTKVYLFSNERLTPIVENACNNITGCRKELDEVCTNREADPKEREKMLDKFLRHADNGLKLLLQSYPLPLFIMGAASTIDHFKSITQNGPGIVDYVAGHFGSKEEKELMQIMEYYVSDWKNVQQRQLLKQVEEANHLHKLSVGIKDVWIAASHKRVKSLLIEKSFTQPAGMRVSGAGLTFIPDQKMRDAFYIKDMVDDVIEKVLARGGDVAFVDDGLLQNYSKIALIECFNPFDGFQ